jgi:LacI family transcriptional regulator
VNETNGDDGTNGAGEISIKDVGRVAGVSISTVSHVLNRTRYVSPALRTRVEAAVADLGYRHNGLARGLRTRRTETVGLIIPDVSNPYYPQLARGVQDAADAAGFAVFVCNSDRRPDNEARLLAALAQRRVDGVILDAAGPSPAVLAALARYQQPVVLVGSRIDAAHVPGADVVQMAPEGGRTAVAHLLQRGHRRIGLIAGPPRGGGAPGEGAGDRPAKSGGYFAALADAGLVPDPALIVSADYTRPGGRAAMERLLALPPGRRPTAVFAGNDLMAIGALLALRAAGLGVPGDVAVVGYDDIPEAAVTCPALTTVAVPKYEMGRVAADLLLARIAHRQGAAGGTAPGAPRRVVLPCRLTVREST